MILIEKSTNRPNLDMGKNSQSSLINYFENLDKLGYDGSEAKVYGQTPRCNVTRATRSIAATSAAVRRLTGLL